MAPERTHLVPHRIPTTTIPTADGKGKRTRLTPELVEAAAELVRGGATPFSALISLGVPKSTVSEWLRTGRGEQPTHPHPHARYQHLAYEMDLASAEFQQKTARSLAEPGEHWKARLAVLARHDPGYREDRPPSHSGSPLEAITAHLREMRRLVEARGGAAPQLRVIDAEARMLPLSGDDS